MGIVSDEEFELEINRLSDKSNHLIEQSSPINNPEQPQVIVEDVKRGKPEGRTDIPDIIRESIARSAIDAVGTKDEIARAFGVSPSTVSAYKVGATSCATYNEPNSKLLGAVKNHKERISKKARGKLMLALDSITPAKSENAKVAVIAHVATALSSIVKNMEPETSIQNQNNVQFVFMAPKVQNEENYSIIDVVD